MKEAITKCYQKSQSRSRARARAFLGQIGSQSRATFFHKLKREPRAEPLKKMAWLSITDYEDIIFRKSKIIKVT